jgi:hypothetical protein
MMAWAMVRLARRAVPAWMGSWWAWTTAAREADLLPRALLTWRCEELIATGQLLETTSIDNVALVDGSPGSMPKWPSDGVLPSCPRRPGTPTWHEATEIAPEPLVSQSRQA